MDNLLCTTATSTVTHRGSLITITAKCSGVPWDLSSYFRATRRWTIRDLQNWLFINGAFLHNERDPALIIQGTQGRYTVKAFFWGGVLHREGGPAYILETSGGTVLERYALGGDVHRSDGPAVTLINARGLRVVEFWSNGERHRLGGPAYIKTASNGCRTEKYFEFGRLIGSASRPRSDLLTVTARQ